MPAAGGDKGSQRLLLQLGKRPNITFTIQAGKGCCWAVLAPRNIKPSAGAGCATIMLTWPVMHFCEVLPCTVYLQPLIEGSLGNRLKGGNAPAFSVCTLAPGLCQAAAEPGAVALALPGSNAGDGAQRLLHPLLLPNLLPIKPQLCTVLHCTVGSFKCFLLCGFCLARTHEKQNKIAITPILP